MAFRTPLNFDPTSDIEVINDNEETLTSLTKLERAFQDGRSFEAAVSLASIIEGLSLAFLYFAIREGRPVKATVRDRMRAEHITFGTTARALQASGMLEPSLSRQLVAFVEDRNHLAHHVALGRKPFNYERSFKEGRELARALWALLMAHLKTDL